MRKRSHRLEKMARVYDDEILPIWTQRFGRMLLRGLSLPPKAMVLDVGCRTGYPAEELLKQMEDGGRIIAIEPIGALLDVARKKLAEHAGKRIFLRTETLSSKLAFADDVYDLVVSNLSLLEHPDPQKATREFARVTKPGGTVVLTLPLKGTFGEFYDIFREVLTKMDKHDILERLETHIAKTPDAETATRWMEEAGLTEVKADLEQFTLLFKTSREFFFAPVIEYGPLAGWKEIAGKGQEMQETFWRIKEAIDAYFEGRAFETTVHAGCFRGIKQQGAASPEPEAEPESEVTRNLRPIPSAELRAGAAEPEPEPDPGAPVVRDTFALDEDEEPEPD